MGDRLAGKIAIVVGGGQTPGSTIGNGRATAILFAREGAKVWVVDRRLESAQDTVDTISSEGGSAMAHGADVTEESDVSGAIAACIERWGAIDILHNNVGVSIEGGDAPITEIESEAFDRIVAINLRGMIYACKHVLPTMKEQGHGAIVNISSMAAMTPYPLVGYKTTKAAVVALTEQIAARHARYGIRANVILPGLMNTPMAVEARVKSTGKTREEVIAGRDANVPLGRKMGTGWDVAAAALFLASDEAKFITGVSLPVDGGTSVRAL